MYAVTMGRNMKFQSTPLMRGETLTHNMIDAILYISIHSPHARGDLLRPAPLSYHLLFQSTPLMRGETLPTVRAQISGRYFNPLPSCEGRLEGCEKMVKA